MLEAKSNAQRLKLLWIVLCLRSVLFLVEFLTGLQIHSLSLLALSGHFFVDLSAVIIAIIAAWLVEHSAQTKFPLKPKQIEAIATLINGFILLTVTGSIVWGITNNFHTSTFETGLPMLGIALFGFAIKALNATLLYEESHHNLNIRGVFFHAIADGASSLGLLIAALVIFYLNWFWIDTVASLLVVIFMLTSVFFLLKDSVQILIGQEKFP